MKVTSANGTKKGTQYESVYDFFAGSVPYGSRRSCPNGYGVVKINLGTADKFALLGGSGVTNVSAQTYIIGDVGSSPTPAITGLIASQVKGRLFLKASPVTAQAQKDLTVAYGEAAGTPCGTDLTGKDLGGMRLGPGIILLLVVSRIDRYADARCSRQSRFPVGFQIGSTLTTATNSKVVMVLGRGLPRPLWAKGLRGCNVYWQVGSSATIGTGHIFVGKILALARLHSTAGPFAVRV